MFANLSHTFVSIPPLILVAGAVCFGISLESAAIAQNDGLRSIQSAMLFESQGKLLKAINAIESKPMDSEFAPQFLAMLYSFAGDWEKVHHLKSKRQRNNIVTAPADATLVPALEAIVDQARERQIVVVNESHNAPHHREFIWQLARRLRDVGFEYYAMETLQESPQRLKKRGYPVRSTGAYSSEPVYGQLIRQALRIGYIPIAYEASAAAPTGDPVNDINAREKAQCANLVERVLTQAPGAKLLVHVGFDHVMESPRKAGNKQIHWLAARLKTTAGIDPLTIDQITGLRFDAIAAVVHDEPVVVSKADGEFIVDGYFKGSVDMQVFHPRIRSRDGRPDWMFRDKQRVAVPLPAGITADSGKVLIQAYYANESADAVPADQFVIATGKPRPTLVLKPGRYRIITQDEQGIETSRHELSVPEPSQSNR